MECNLFIYLFLFFHKKKHSGTYIIFIELMVWLYLVNGSHTHNGLLNAQKNNLRSNTDSKTVTIKSEIKRERKSSCKIIQKKNFVYQNIQIKCFVAISQI